MEQIQSIADELALQVLLYPSMPSSELLTLADQLLVCLNAFGVDSQKEAEITELLSRCRDSGVSETDFLSSLNQLVHIAQSVVRGGSQASSNDKGEVIPEKSSSSSSAQVAVRQHIEQPDDRRGVESQESYRIEDPDDFLADFFLEAEEYCSTIETTLTTGLGKDSGSAIDSLFRAVHSLKGGAGYFNLVEVAETAHVTETLMDKVRRKTLPFSDEVQRLLLSFVDLQRELFARVAVAIESSGEMKRLSKVGSYLNRLEEFNKSGKWMSDELGVSDVADIAVNHTESDPRLLNPSNEPTASRADKVEDGKTFVKIDTKRLDQLIEQLGEMAISSSQLIRSCREALAHDEAIQGTTNQLERITREVQEIGMGMRLVPLRGMFQKLSRVVWDTAERLKKDIRFELAGEDEELDRAILEKLGEPLMHMLRNAVDHGIEGKEERVALGKAAAGAIYLSAYHSSGKVVIELRDDGRGIDPVKILQKAKQQGIVVSESLSRKEVFDLIFAPGFSTATTVTSVSGRGVGMDVVRSTITSLRGTISIDSTFGQGTTFRIELPLTMASLDGTEVKVGEEHFIVPTLGIIEILQVRPEMMVTPMGRVETMEFRGAYLPIYRIGKLLNCNKCARSLTEGVVIVLENGERRAAFLVDAVIGKLSVVIKSLGPVFEKVKGVSGCSIMPNGAVGLILDVPSLFHLGREAEGVESGNRQGEYAM